MKLPIEKVIMPSNLSGVSNGDLPEGLLRTVGPGGKLHVNAARAFESMAAAAKTAGFSFVWTYGGTYRSLQSQIALFERRYDRDYVEGRNVKTGARTWNGVRYYKKKGVAAAATPGKSNHGWGLAIDLALDKDPTDGINPEDAVSIAPALNWLKVHAKEHGFSAELASEPWHWRYVAGDNIPEAVREFERNGSPAQSPEPSPKADRPTLRIGSTGDDVRLLQSALRARGFTITVDGVFGQQTDRTVRAFQQRVGIVVDGIVGRQTFDALDDSKPRRETRPTVRVGSQGDDVRFLQRVLHADGASIVVDGRFGHQTGAHVRAFQKKHGLTVDGVCGTKQTWPKINEVADIHEVAP